MRRIVTPVAFLALLPLAAASAEQAYSPKTEVTQLLATSQTTVGQPIAYPAGTAHVTAAIVTVPPGAETGWHTHAVPLYGYMLAGTLTVDYGSKGTHVYKAGDSFMEAMNWPHNGVNKGHTPVRILAVYMGATGIPNATPVAK